MRTKSNAPKEGHNETSLEIVNYKRAVRSPEVFRLLFEAINGQDPGELVAERHSPDVPFPLALSLYHSQDRIPYLAGVFRNLERIEQLAKIVGCAIMDHVPEIERFDWRTANSIFFIKDSGMAAPPPIIEWRWLAIGLDDDLPHLPEGEHGKTYVILLDSTRPCGVPDVQEALALLQGQRTSVTTELGHAVQTLLEAENG